MISSAAAVRIPEIMIDVVEPGRRAGKGRTRFDLGRDVAFSTAGLESYAFARWEPVIYDAMVVAAAIEYGDRIIKRPPRRVGSAQIYSHSGGRSPSLECAGGSEGAPRRGRVSYWGLLDSGVRAPLNQGALALAKPSESAG